MYLYSLALFHQHTTFFFFFFFKLISSFSRQYGKLEIPMSLMYCGSHPYACTVGNSLPKSGITSLYYFCKHFLNRFSLFCFSLLFPLPLQGSSSSLSLILICTPSSLDNVKTKLPVVRSRELNPVGILPIHQKHKTIIVIKTCLDKGF